MTTPLNTTSPNAGAAVNTALAGGSTSDIVGSALGAATGSDYLKYGSQALGALQGLSSSAGPNGGANISTPNFNNGSTLIVNYGSGGISAPTSASNTQSVKPDGGDSSPIKNLFSGLTNSLSSTTGLIVAAVLGVIVIRKLKGG